MNTQSTAFKEAMHTPPTRFIKENGSGLTTPNLIAFNEVNPFEEDFMQKPPAGPTKDDGELESTAQGLLIMGTSPAGDPTLGLRLLAEAQPQRSPILLQTPKRRRTGDGDENPDPVGKKTTPSKRQSAQSNAAKAVQSPSSTSESETGQDDFADRGDLSASERRRLFLERNKQAASKCRARKKEWITGLEERAEKLTAATNQLHNQVLLSRHEYELLREVLLAHRSCNCENIHAYIRQGGPTTALLQTMSKEFAEKYEHLR